MINALWVPPILLRYSPRLAALPLFTRRRRGRALTFVTGEGTLSVLQLHSWRLPVRPKGATIFAFIYLLTSRRTQRQQGLSLYIQTSKSPQTSLIDIPTSPQESLSLPVQCHDQIVVTSSRHPTAGDTDALRIDARHHAVMVDLRIFIIGDDGASWMERYGESSLDSLGRTENRSAGFIPYHQLHLSGHPFRLLSQSRSYAAWYSSLDQLVMPRMI
jgi:hypothetical protein